MRKWAFRSTLLAIVGIVLVLVSAIILVWKWYHKDLSTFKDILHSKDLRRTQELFADAQYVDYPFHYIAIVDSMGEFRDPAEFELHRGEQDWMRQTMVLSDGKELFKIPADRNHADLFVYMEPESLAELSDIFESLLPRIDELAIFVLPEGPFHPNGKCYLKGDWDVSTKAVRRIPVDLAGEFQLYRKVYADGHESLEGVTEFTCADGTTRGILVECRISTLRSKVQQRVTPLKNGGIPETIEVEPRAESVTSPREPERLEEINPD